MLDKLTNGRDFLGWQRLAEIESRGVAWITGYYFANESLVLVRGQRICRIEDTAPAAPAANPAIEAFNFENIRVAFDALPGTSGRTGCGFDFD